MMKDIATENLIDGLFIIHSEKQAGVNAVTGQSHPNTVLWHQRLGHPSISTLQKLDFLRSSLHVSCKDVASVGF